MISLQQHIDQQHGGNVTAFAKSVGRSRPLAYRWLRDGALWINGRVHDPVTPPQSAIKALAAEDTMAKVLKLISSMEDSEVRTVTISHEGRAELIFEVSAASARAMLNAHDAEYTCNNCMTVQLAVIECAECGTPGVLNNES